MRLNAVFQGGGVKGIALVGALSRVEENGHSFDRIGGTSAGSMVAALYAAGYTAQEMKDIFLELDFRDLLDPSWPRWWDLVKHKGIYKGDRLYQWFGGLLRKKGVVTFRDLPKHLKIVASDLTNKELLVFDSDKNPTMKVAEAVRMSTAIPLVFEAYRYGEKLVVDGGILSNFPMWLFADGESDDDLLRRLANGTPPGELTIGFKLVSEEETNLPMPPNTFVGYLWALMGTMMDAHDKRTSYDNVIEIDTGTITSTDFALTKDQKKFLYHSGYTSATRFVQARDRDLSRHVIDEVADVVPETKKEAKRSNTNTAKTKR